MLIMLKRILPSIETINKIVLFSVICIIIFGVLTVNNAAILIGSFFSFFYSVFSIEMMQKLFCNIYFFLTGKSIKYKFLLFMISLLLTIISFLISVQLEKLPAPFLFLRIENFSNVLMGISIIISYLDVIFCDKVC